MAKMSISGYDKGVLPAIYVLAGSLFMSDFPPNRQLPPEVLRQLQDLSLRINVPFVAQRAWDRLLTDADRQELGGDLELAFRQFGKLIGMWMRLNRVSEVRAILELAQRLNFLAEADFQWLARETGEESLPAPPVSPKPSWNSDRCELFFEGAVIRKIRGRSVATNLVMILDSFQQQGWPDRIDYPFSGIRDPQRLREAVATLNEGVTAIRFRCDGSSAGILWERC
jgi:hypothetical protein